MPAPAPPEIRARAVELVQTIGVREAAKQCGVSPASVSRWAIEQGVEKVHSEQIRARIKAAEQKWEERRTRLVHDMGRTAELAREKSEELLEAGKVRDAQSAAVTMAILVDKAQLLSGGATSRSASISELDEEIQRLADKINTPTPVDA